jgi:hypothetical protein
MDFSNTLLRSSSIGYLMTEPQSKADKEAGLLSKTSQAHLIEVYIDKKYDRQRDIQTKQMKKGTLAEEDSIDLLSRFLKKPLQKNEDRIKNDFITGLPDIFEGRSIKDADNIIDIKTSYDCWTFLANITGKLDSIYYWQLQSYMWLTGAKTAQIAYCLVDTPESIIMQEKYYLLKKMDVVSEESPAYLEAASKLDFSMRFTDIPVNERVLMFQVDRSEDDILKIQHKVEVSRNFLHEIELNHLNFNNFFKK